MDEKKNTGKIFPLYASLRENSNLHIVAMLTMNAFFQMQIKFTIIKDLSPENEEETAVFAP